MYLMPETFPFQIAAKVSILAASNGEDLNLTNYGSRGVAEDDVNDFWD